MREGLQKIKQELNKVLKTVLVHFMGDPLMLWPVMFILNIFIHLIGVVCNCTHMILHHCALTSFINMYVCMHMYGWMPCMVCVHARVKVSEQLVSSSDAV